MSNLTCAACDDDLGPNPIQVKIGGKTVEVCCEECAKALNEASADTTGSATPAE